MEIHLSSPLLRKRQRTNETERNIALESTDILLTDKSFLDDSGRSTPYNDESILEHHNQSFDNCNNELFDIITDLNSEKDCIDDAESSPLIPIPGVKSWIGAIFGVFREELTSTEYANPVHGFKSDRINNFLSVPKEFEKLLWFGCLILLDSFLYIFTIFPIRFFIATTSLLYTTLKRTRMKSTHQVDLVKGLLIISTLYLIQTIDASIVYHSIRGQSTLKLYVIFNVLEICDKLCSAFGHDILDSLFSFLSIDPDAEPITPTLAKIGKAKLGRITIFVIALVYNYCHCVVLFYHMMTLNVAINSFSTSLLTLMMSNQFVEIKSSVFKRFEKENLFQMCSSDIVERFQLTIYMLLITIRNFLELNGGLQSLIQTLSPLPPLTPLTIHSILTNQTIRLLIQSLKPACIVLFVEMLVDWLKHAFITKFNLISPCTFGKFRDSLSRDCFYCTERGESLGVVGRRRMGFLVLPVVCLVVRVLMQTFGVGWGVKGSRVDFFLWWWGGGGSGWSLVAVGATFIFYFWLVGFKIGVGMLLRFLAKRRTTKLEAMGISSRKMSTSLHSPIAKGNNTGDVFIFGALDRFTSTRVDHKALEEDKLDHVERFTMIKRII